MYANTVRLYSWTSPRRECREHLRSPLPVVKGFLFSSLQVLICLLVFSFIIPVFSFHCSIIIFSLLILFGMGWKMTACRPTPAATTTEFRVQQHAGRAQHVQQGGRLLAQH